MSPTGRKVCAGLGVSAASIVVPFIELRIARHGHKIIEQDFKLDGHVGHEGVASAARATPLHIVWLGDSTAAGVGADGVDGALPRQVATHLTRPVSMNVFARSGARIADVVAQQVPRLASLGSAPDLILVSVGANDVSGRTPRRAFVRDYTTMLEASVATGARVVVLGVPDMSCALVLAEPLRTFVGMRARVVDRWLRAAVANHGGVGYVDLTGRKRVPRRALGDYLCADRYHPNDAGYRVWAALVGERVTEFLNQPVVVGGGLVEELGVALHHNASGATVAS